MDEQRGLVRSNPALSFQHPYPPTKVAFIPDKVRRLLHFANLHREASNLEASLSQPVCPAQAALLLALLPAGMSMAAAGDAAGSSQCTAAGRVPPPAAAMPAAHSALPAPPGT